MKPIKSLLLLFSLAVFVLAGCGRHSSKEVYYMVGHNLALPYWQTAAAGFNKAAAQYRVTAKVVGPASYDPQAELTELHKAIAAKPAGILISVADESALQPEINAAIAAGIPVITFDSDAPGSRRLFFIGTNNLEAGRIGGQRVIEKLGGKGNVVFFTQPGQPNLEERLKGFREVFASRPEVHIAAVVNIKTDPRSAFDWTQESISLSGDKKIDAYVCLESASGVQVAEALKRMHVSDRLLVSWDANPDTLDGIKTGAIDSTISQKPFTMAYTGLRMLDAIYHDAQKNLSKDQSANSFAPYPVFVDTGSALVEKSNVDLYLAGAADGR
jgi:ribose transport system substrate-binding protein